MHSTNGTKQNTVSKILFFFFEKIEIETVLVIINREKIQIPILFEKILLNKSIILKSPILFNLLVPKKTFLIFHLHFLKLHI